jgi:hypothetical protein
MPDASPIDEDRDIRHPCLATMLFNRDCDRGEDIVLNPLAVTKKAYKTQAGYRESTGD